MTCDRRLLSILTARQGDNSPSGENAVIKGMFMLPGTIPLRNLNTSRITKSHLTKVKHIYDHEWSIKDKAWLIICEVWSVKCEVKNRCREFLIRRLQIFPLWKASSWLLSQKKNISIIIKCIIVVQNSLYFKINHILGIKVIWHQSMSVNLKHHNDVLLCQWLL